MLADRLEFSSRLREGEDGRSSVRRVLKALKIRGMKRDLEELEMTEEALSGNGGAAKVDDGTLVLGEVDGRRVVADLLDLEDVERVKIPGIRSRIDDDDDAGGGGSEPALVVDCPTMTDQRRLRLGDSAACCELA